MRTKKSSLSPLRVVVRVILLLMVILELALAPLMLAIHRAAQVDETRQADAILVLGAGLEPDGEPSAAMRARAERAAWLYKQGYANLVAVTGGPPPGLPSEASVTRDLIVAAGVPVDVIIMEELSQSTTENLSYITPLLAEYDVQHVLLVTSPFHNWRAEQIALDSGLTVYLSPALGDPAERKPLKRVWYIAREAAAWLVYSAIGN